MVVMVEMGWIISGDGQQVHLWLLGELWSMTETTHSDNWTNAETLVLRGQRAAAGGPKVKQEETAESSCTERKNQRESRMKDRTRPLL